MESTSMARSDEWHDRFNQFQPMRALQEISTISRLGVSAIFCGRSACHRLRHKRLDPGNDE
jgi:hypothetical protein